MYAVVKMWMLLSLSVTFFALTWEILARAFAAPAIALARLRLGWIWISNPRDFERSFGFWILD